MVNSAANRAACVRVDNVSKTYYPSPGWMKLLVRSNIKREVTAPRLAEHFRAICAGPVEVYPLDNLLAIKIVLNRALQGGAARSLRMDNLGKTIAAALLKLEIEVPDELPAR